MSIKRTTGLILLAKSEASYGAGAAVTGSTDTIDICEQFPTFELAYADDGSRGMGQYAHASLIADAPSGKTTDGVVKIYGKGNSGSISAGAPYVHPFLLASGLSASFEAGTQVYKVKPVGTDPVSMALAVYDAGEVLPVSGAYCTMEYEAQGPKPIVFTFNVKGLAGSYSDIASPPARVFPASGSIAPAAKNIALSIGSFTTAVVRSFKVAMAGEIQARMDQNSVDGHAGFFVIPGDVTLTLVIEAPSRSTFDADSDRTTSGLTKAVSFTVGSVLGNKITTSLARAQLMGVKRQNDGKLRTLELTYVAKILNEDANDQFSVTWT